MAAEIASPDLLRFIRNILPVHMVRFQRQRWLTDDDMLPLVFTQETWKAEAALEKIVQTLAATIREMRAHQLQQQQRLLVQPAKPRGSTSSTESNKPADKSGDSKDSDDPSAVTKAGSSNNNSSS